jgi:magnesium-transporting ATPase (P-type)
LSDQYAQNKSARYSVEDLGGGMENAYIKTPAEALKHFQVTEEKGLSEQQVKDLRAKHGKNGMLAITR